MWGARGSIVGAGMAAHDVIQVVGCMGGHTVRADYGAKGETQGFPWQACPPPAEPYVCASAIACGGKGDLGGCTCMGDQKSGHQQPPLHTLPLTKCMCKRIIHNKTYTTNICVNMLTINSYIYEMRK